MSCTVVNSESQVQSRLPSLPQSLPKTQADWNALLATLNQWGSILQQASHAPNVIPSQFQTFSVSAATAVIAALSAANCAPSVDSGTQYYGGASLKVAISASGATLAFAGYPISIAPASRWFASFQIYAPSGCTGSLTVKTSAGHTVTESFTVAALAEWQQVWGLTDLRQYADTQATWQFTFTSTATVWLDGLQMNAVGSPIGTLPKFAGTQMVTGALAYQSNLDGVPDGSTYARPLGRYLLNGRPIGNWLVNTPWIIGTTGNQGNFQDIGSVQPSAIYLGGTGGTPLGPYGISEPLWIAYGGVHAANGGWNNSADLQGIDSTKTYRSSVWVYLESGGAGTPAFLLGWDTSYTNDIGGAQDTNPYSVDISFSSLTPGKWYLAVGVLHGSGYTGADSGISGIYDPATGQRIFAGQDFVCRPNAPQQTQRVYHYYDTATDWVAFAKPRFEEVNGNEPSIQTLLAPAYGVLAYANNIDGAPDGVTYMRFLASFLDAARRVRAENGAITPLGSIPPGASTVSFTYTSTANSVTINWTAGTIYRPDGTTTAVSSGSQTITGLAASTTYYVAIYYDEVAHAIAFASVSGAAGTPAIAYTTQIQSAAGAMILNAHSTFGWFTTATPASGSGGGGGPPSCCLHAEQVIELANGRAVRAADLRVDDYLTCPTGVARVVKLRIEPWGEWFRVTFSNGIALLVAADHRFLEPSGEQVKAHELRLQQIVQARESYVYVRKLEFVEEPADKVSIEVTEPHTYYVQSILAHNKQMCL